MRTPPVGWRGTGRTEVFPAKGRLMFTIGSSGPSRKEPLPPRRVNQLLDEGVAVLVGTADLLFALVAHDAPFSWQVRWPPGANGAAC